MQETLPKRLRSFDPPSDIDLAATFDLSYQRRTSGRSSSQAAPPQPIIIPLEDFVREAPVRQQFQFIREPKSTSKLSLSLAAASLPPLPEDDIQQESSPEIPQEPSLQAQIAVPPKQFKTWQRFGQEVLNYPLGAVFLLTGMLSSYTELASPYNETYKMSIPGFIYTWRQVLHALAYYKKPLSELREIGSGNLAAGLCKKTGSVLVASGLTVLVGYGLGTFMEHASNLDQFKESLKSIIGTGWPDSNPFSLLFLGSIGYGGFRLGEAGLMKIGKQFDPNKTEYKEESGTLGQTCLQCILRFCDTVGTTIGIIFLLPNKMPAIMHWQTGLLVISDTLLRISKWIFYKEDPFMGPRMCYPEEETDSQLTSSQQDRQQNKQALRGTKFWSIVQGAEGFLVYLLTEMACEYLEKDKCAEGNALKRMGSAIGIYGSILTCEFIISNMTDLLVLKSTLLSGLSKCGATLFKWHKKTNEQQLIINNPDEKATSYTYL